VIVSGQKRPPGHEWSKRNSVLRLSIGFVEVLEVLAIGFVEVALDVFALGSCEVGKPCSPLKVEDHGSVLLCLRGREAFDLEEVRNPFLDELPGARR
jgi:hypothetical protein